MPYKNLKSFIEVLEKNGELVRIKERINPQLESTEIIDRLSKNNGPAVLFENTGFAFPLLMNSMGSYKRICLALGVKNLDDIPAEIENFLKMLAGPKSNWLDKIKLLPRLGELANWMPVVKKGRGDCQQVVMNPPDITKLPIQKCWPQDGGNFLTLPIIHTKDPETGIRNVGLYRMQVFGPTLTAMHWHRHKVSAKHFSVYKKLNKRIPVVVALGGDPVNTYVATAPMPEGIDEYMLSGFIRKKKVELVQCLTQDAQVPADADFIIEGYIDPEEELILEGPFGDHTGYYSLPDLYPRFHITAITHRRDAIYPGTIVGIPPQEDAWLGKATERIFLTPIKMLLIPEIVDMNLPMEGVFHNLAIIKIKKDYPGQALKVMNSIWGAGQMMFTKMIIIVDGTVNIHNYWEVAQYAFQNVEPGRDIIFSQGPVDVLDHSCSVMSFGGKMGVDATEKLPEECGKKGKEEREKGGKWENGKLADSIKKFTEIVQCNLTLLEKNIPLIILSVKKNKRNHVEELTKKLFEQDVFRKIKVIIYLEHTIDISDITSVFWRFSNNIDPRRDSYIINMNGATHIGLDGTRKTKEMDGFEREWPNILISDSDTVRKIDTVWDKLGLGKFIPSPSLKFREQMYGQGAVAGE